MDRGKQPAASPPPPPPQRTAYPTGFEAYFSAMGLGGASSSSLGQEPQTPRQAQRQQRYATPTSPLMLPPPPPSQGGGGQGGVHPLMQQLQMMAQMRATQQQQQQQPSSYCVGEGSSINGYFWPVGNGGVSPAAAAHAQGSSDYAMLLAADRPMPLAADRILPSAADGSSSDYLSRFANGYANNTFAAAAAPPAPRPPVAPRACTLRANASQYQPIGASSRSAVAAPSPSSTRRYPYPHPANNYNPIADNPVQDYQEHLVVLNALRANPEDPLWRGVSRISQGRTPEEIRSDMFRGPMPLQLVFFQESAAHVIRLLDEGVETGVDQYRLSALATIKSDVHRVMEDKEGCQVFMALVRACAEQEDEIHAIIAAAAAAANAPPVDGNGKPKTTQLLRVTRQDYGEASLRALILAAARFPDLCKLLTDCLVCERVMDHPKGDRLLHDCFRAMNYEDSKILIKFACYHANKMLLASSGSRCLVECFMNARDEELEHLEQLILANATMIAKGHYSNYFMQKVLEHGGEALKRELVVLLMADVVSLSRQQFGSYVVEACFLKGSSGLKHLVISTFVSLTNDQLADVVQCGYGNYVIQKLVDTCKDEFPEETILLARRIERLPGDVLDRMSAKQVMKVVRRLFPRHRIY